MTRILFKFIICPSCERALKKGRVKSKIVRKPSLNSFLVSAVLAKVKQSHTGWNFLKIWDSHLNNVFCMMSSFWSMTQVADWTLTREIIKYTNVLYPVGLKKSLKKLDKHLWRGPFSESCTFTHHSLLKMNHRLLGIWGRYWLK